MNSVPQHSKSIEIRYTYETKLQPARPRLLAVLVAFFFIQVGATAATAAAPVKWTIDGVAREALVFPPTKQSKTGAPVIFAFHGHGGTMQNASRSFHFQDLWPEAIVVYMQGLLTPSRIDPNGKRPGWQKGAGDQADRDLKFFDTVLATLKKDYQLDARRIYATGHSNGGGFTYLLWAERGDVLAAVAPCAAGPGSLQAFSKLKPKPAIHIAGEQDSLVPIANQKRTIEAIRRSNGCASEGQQWAKDCTLYPSKNDTPVVAMIHTGTHKFPTEAPALVVKFFQEHTKK